MLIWCNFIMYNIFDMKMLFFIWKVLIFVMYYFVNFIYCVEGGGGGGEIMVLNYKMDFKYLFFGKL